MRALYCLPALALVAGCATTGPKTPGDPYEAVNRKIWNVDEKLDKVVLKPVAKGYISIMPHVLRHGLSNMLENVTEPFSVINAVLQAKPRRALNSLGRFVINSTVGIAGFRDVAGRNGYKPTPEDLGQTFAVWGAKKSSYLVLPLYGPSTIRDGIGTIAAEWVDPYRIVIRKELSFWPASALTVFEFVDARANLIDSGADALLESSADSYAVTRSAYLQRRNAEIEDRDDGTDASGTSSDDAQLNAALDELGSPPANGSAAPAGAATPAPEPTLAPDQPKVSHPGDPAPASPGGMPR